MTHENPLGVAVRRPFSILGMRNVVDDCGETLR